jgi:hypothetical protein
MLVQRAARLFARSELVAAAQHDIGARGREPLKYGRDAITSISISVRAPPTVATSDVAA